MATPHQERSSIGSQITRLKERFPRWSSSKNIPRSGQAFVRDGRALVGVVFAFLATASIDGVSASQSPGQGDSGVGASGSGTVGPRGMMPGGGRPERDEDWMERRRPAMKIPTNTSTATASSTATEAATRTATGTATRTATASRTPDNIPTVTRTPETQFYAQRRLIDGVEIRASAVVDVRALDLAENNFRLLTNFELASRSRMVTNQFGGYVIIGRNQQLTDLPEWTQLKGKYYYVDPVNPANNILYDDMRGISTDWPGGTTAIAEEILLDNSAFVCHEQSHPRLNYGFTNEQEQEWASIYTDARNRNLFPGTYAMRSGGEYWAENSRLWCGDPVGFTLDDLRIQDPAAYNFLMDRLGQPQTAMQGEFFAHATVFELPRNVPTYQVIYPGSGGREESMDSVNFQGSPHRILGRLGSMVMIAS